MQVKQKNSSLLAYLVVGSALLLSSCASLTGFQDGRTIGENRGEVMVSLNISQSPNFIDLDESTDSAFSNIIPTFSFPNLEVGGRYGIIDKLDITLKMNTNLNVAVGTKYQFLGDQSSKFALATGLDVGTFGLGLGLWNVQIPLYASFHPSPKVAIYASPRFIYQFTTFADLANWNYLGGNVGLLFGKKHKFGIDAGFYQVGAKGTGRLGLTSFGVGGKFVIGKSRSEEDSRMRD